MKIDIGSSCNKTGELISGIILMGLGGFLLGITLLNFEYIIISMIGIGIFTVGIILSVRVQSRSSQDLDDAKKRIEEVKKEASDDATIKALVFG